MLLQKTNFLTDIFSKSSIYVNCPRCLKNHCKCKNKKDLKDYKTILLSRVVLGNAFIERNNRGCCSIENLLQISLFVIISEIIRVTFFWYCFFKINWVRQTKHIPSWLTVSSSFTHKTLLFYYFSCLWKSKILFLFYTKLINELQPFSSQLGCWQSR